MSNKKITKSNSIINSSFRFSLNELRIVLYGLSRIDPMAKEYPLFHRINVNELAQFYDIGEKERGSFYDNIKHALITKFWERDFSYYDEELGKMVKRRWLIEVRYGGKDSTLDYEYNPKLKNQLQELSKRFTSYFLENIANMKSAYAVRIYEIAVMYLNASKQQKVKFTKTIEVLKHHLDITDKYKLFFNFKTKVIEIAKRDINRHSDINLSYKIIKLGRTPHEIAFTITYKKPKEIQQNIEEKLPYLSKDDICLSTIIIEKAKDIVLNSGNRWDIYAIIEDFKEYAKRKGIPNNINGAFIGFVKKKAQRMP